MSEIQHTDEIITKDYLKAFYDSIFPYLGGAIPSFANKFNRSDIYDGTEKIVGGWFGKPLYQKSIDCGALPNNATKTIAHGITALENTVMCYGMVFIPSVNTTIPLPWHASGGLTTLCAVTSINTTNIELITSGDRTNCTATITLLYTKTTDAAGSFIGANENDYSTDEHIIGTWVDGSAIYQKTISCGALPNTTSSNVPHGVSNIKNLITMTGFSTNGTYTIPLPHVSGSSVSLYCSATDVILVTVADASAYTTTYVTIQYTKTV